MHIINSLLPYNCFKEGRKQNIDSLIIHYISAVNIDKNHPFELSNIIQIFKDNKVSTHYLIDRHGDIYRLVEEKNIAYHAGKSNLNGRENVNNFSIGIELVGGENWKFENIQYEALITLTKDIKNRYNIPITNIVGHDYIAPGRKIDPGKNFEWNKYLEGIKNEFINAEIKVDKFKNIDKSKYDIKDNKISEKIQGKQKIISLIKNVTNFILEVIDAFKRTME